MLLPLLSPPVRGEVSKKVEGRACALFHNWLPARGGKTFETFRRLCSDVDILVTWRSETCCLFESPKE